MLKLSEAIRLGSMASEKAIGTRRDDSGARYNGQLRDGKNITPWSRESIADWVEKIESEETPALTPETEEVCVGR